MRVYYFVTGDGGNDVSMIQAADCGIGIEGKVKPSINHSLANILYKHNNPSTQICFIKL